MNIFEIPVRNDILSYEMIINLDNVDYNLSFDYNFRDKHWYMSIPGIIEGQRLTNSEDIFSQFRHLKELPKGILFIDDITGNDDDPSLNNFGNTVKLMYLEQS